MDEQKNSPASFKQPPGTTRTVSKTTHPKAKWSMKLLLFTVALLLIAGAAYGTYLWQHSKVNSLSTTNDNLSKEVQSQMQKIYDLEANAKKSSSTTNKTSTITNSEPCTASDIKLSTVNAPGAAGNEGESLIFTNNSDSSCTLFGYPLVQYEDKNGNIIGNVQEELMGSMIYASTAPMPITLAANQQASVGLGWTEGGANSSNATTTLVYLPGDSKPLTLTKAVGPSTANTGDPFVIDVTAIQMGSSPKVN